VRTIHHLRQRLTRLSTWRAFTLIELLTVMAIIAILAGLILSISGFAQKKAALSRAQAEIQAISAACESYKADNGTYPHQPLATSGTINFTNPTIPSDSLYPTASSSANPTNNNSASLELYEALTGDLSCTGTGGGPGVKNYIADMKPDCWGRNNMGAPVSGSNTILYISDPFGNSYGYSTAQATAIQSGSSSATYGYNPTFDLWSTGGAVNLGSTPGAFGKGTTGDVMLQWVKNW
jgi:prepilin-type N-terminal cleavage/methylation domain-containing protein